MQANTTQHTKNIKHTTNSMSCRCPTLQRLCHLLPWQHPPWPQIKALRLLASPLQAPGSGFTLASACSFVWGTDTYPTKK